MKIQRSNIETVSQIAKSVFLSEAWLKMYGDALEVYGIFDKGNHIIGGFVLFVEKRKGLKYYRNPIFMPHTALFYKNQAANKAKRTSNEKKILKLVADFLNNLPYQVLTLAFPSEIVDMQNFIWNDFKVVPSYTYIIPLNKTMDEIKNDFTAERRKNIRKADSDGIVTKQVKEYNEVKSLIQNTFNRKGKNLSISYLDKILFGFANEENSYAFVSCQDEKPIACTFCIYDKHKVYYLLGGYDSQNSHQGAGSKSMEAAIALALEKGIEYFDFEGSMLPEVERYFRAYGGDLTPYYTVNKAVLPLEMMLKLKHRSQF